MAIPTSIADLTWLLNSEPAGAPFARGVSAGSAIANVGINRQNVALNREQIAMQRERLGMQQRDYADELRIKKAEEARKAQESAIQFAGYQDFTKAVDAGMAPDEAIKLHGAKMFYKSTAYPQFLSNQERTEKITPGITPLKDSSGNTVDVLQTGPNRFSQVRPPSADTFTPEITTLLDSQRNPVDVLRTGKNTVSQLRAPGSGSSDTAIVKDLAKANDMLKQARTLELAGDLDAAKALRDDAIFIKDSHAKSGFTFQSDGQGGFQLTQGGGKIPNLAVNTKVLERLSASEKAIDGLDDLASTLRPGDVGIKGVIGELVLDKILPQFGAKTADLQRIDNRTKLRMLAEGLMRTVSFDSRFSDRDALRIAKITPSPGMAETEEHTRQSIATIKNIFSKRALIDAKEASQPAPPFAIRSLDEDGLKESVEKGLLTMEQGKAEFFKRNPNLAPTP